MSDPKPQPRSKFDILADQVRRAILPSKPPTEKPLLPPGLGGPNDTVAEFAKGLLGLKQEPGMTPSGVGAVLGAVLPVAGATKALGRSVRAAKGLKAAEDVPQGIIAYHGSPHDFDKFDMSKIGTGEGAQAYGHGLYFAENEGIARNYREALATPQFLIDGKPVERELENIAAGMIDQQGGNAALAVKTAQAHLDAAKEWAARQVSGRGLSPMDVQGPIDHWAKVLDTLNDIKMRDVKAIPGGRTYQVRINASPDEFLDWDKPLSEQSEAVKKAISQMKRPEIVDRGEVGYLGDRFLIKINGKTVGSSNTRDIAEENAAMLMQGGGETSKKSAQRLYQDLSGFDYTEPWKSQPSDQSEASSKMLQAGIKGVKYLDAASRKAGEGSRNYVVFDDALVEILKKYGFLPPLAAGAAASYQSRLDAAKKKGGS